MGIKAFIFSLLVLSISLFIVTIILTPAQIKKSQDLPKVTFINSTIYEINTKEVTQIVKSKRAYHYETKEELYDATIILKSKDAKDQENLVTNTISANLIQITDSMVKFRGDVNYNKSTGTTLESEALDYDRITKHLTGDQKFIAFHDGNKLKGNSLSMQENQNIFKSTDNTPLKLDIIMNQKKERNETN